MLSSLWNSSSFTEEETDRKQRERELGQCRPVGSEATPPTRAVRPGPGVAAAPPVASQAVGRSAEHDGGATARPSRACRALPGRAVAEQGRDGALTPVHPLGPERQPVPAGRGQQTSRKGPDGKSFLLYEPDSLCLNLSDLSVAPKPPSTDVNKPAGQGPDKALFKKAGSGPDFLPRVRAPLQAWAAQSWRCHF